ncbi:MAG: hypothetical protein JXR87_10025 [Candidatus Marinimicrobia bacterium]|nr:hypothetical protein [Candidatus Neomarinimicrobiota bacterium]
MKRLIFILFVFYFNGFADGEPEPAKYYLGINPIAPLTSIPNQFTNLYLPLASNLETGMAVNAGLYQNRKTIETRLSYGYPNTLYRLFQIHGGVNYFLAKNSANKGFYTGGFIKYYQLDNRENALRNSSVILYLSLGYRLERRKLFLDMRLNQNIYAVSWSNRENTSRQSDFCFSVYNDISPILPYLSINLGIIFTRQSRNVSF